MKESRKINVYSTTPIKLVGKFESIQRAVVRLKLKSHNKTYKIVDGFNKDGTRKITHSLSLKLDVFLTTKEI